MIEINSSILYFSSLKLSDAGEYMCQVNISSTLLGSDLTILSIPPHTVKVFGKFIVYSLLEERNLLSQLCIVPLPVVTVIPPSRTIFVGSSPTFICTVEFDDTVDVLVMVNIIFESAAAMMSVTGAARMESYTLHIKTLTFDSVQASSSGQEYDIECFTISDVTVLVHSPYILVQSMDIISDSVTISVCK